MCNKRNSKTLIGWNGKPFKVDECLQHLIVVLNKPDYRTLGCCCGHGKYPMTIIVKLTDDRIIEIMSMNEIPRKKRFYLKDGDGYYYIPETIKKKKKIKLSSRGEEEMCQDHAGARNISISSHC